MPITVEKPRELYLVKMAGAIVGEFQSVPGRGGFLFHYATPAILLSAKDLLEIYYKLEELNDDERSRNKTAKT